MPTPLPFPLVEEPDARVSDVPEAVLQDLWLHRRYDATDLRTTTGERVEVLAPGRHNRDGGPDFAGARLRLTPADGPPLLFAGDVEVHRTSGEWYVHRHDEDPRYDRVVLHVTLLDDRHTGTLRRADGTVLPEIVLYPRLGRSLRALLFDFFARPRVAFPCEQAWPDVPVALRRRWVRRLGTARLRAHADRLDTSEGLDRALVGATLRALGFSPNADAMAELARRLPLEDVRHLGDPIEVDALLFGLAGLIPQPRGLAATDPTGAVYATGLAHRFEWLRQGTSASPMAAQQWTYFRLRPSNFPTRRVAQAAALLAPGGPLRDRPIERFREALRAEKPVVALRTLLQTPEPSAFWRDHVRFGQITRPSSARIGQERADRILTDAVLPVLSLDARVRRDAAQSASVLKVLTTLPAADDVIVRAYLSEGFRPADALEAQGLHALARGYCAETRCLRCAVGRHLLQV